MEKTGIRQFPKTLATGVTFASGIWLVVSITILAIAGTSDFALNWPQFVYLVLTVSLSGVSGFAYLVDRRRAAKDRPRVSWIILHVLALAGGWPGALLARRFIGREDESFFFRLVLSLIVTAHIALIGYGLYLYFFPAKVAV